MQTIRIPDELHERFRDACASYKTDAGADPMTQKAFGPIVVAAGLDAIERGAGSVPVPEVAPGAVDVETHYRAEIDSLKVDLDGARAQVDNMGARLAAERASVLTLTSDVERLTVQLHNLAHDELARANASVSESHADNAPASPDDMIAAALAGVTANARKGAKTRGALEALHAIKAMVDAPTLADACAAAAMHYEARLVTLSEQKAKRGGSANGAEGGA